MKNLFSLMFCCLIVHQISGQTNSEETKSMISSKLETYYESIDSRSIDQFKNLFSDRALIWGSSSEETWDIEVFVGIVNSSFSNPEVNLELRSIGRDIILLNDEVVLVAESTFFSQISQTIPTRMIILFKKVNGDWLIDKLFYNLAPDNETMLKINSMDFR